MHRYVVFRVFVLWIKCRSATTLGQHCRLRVKHIPLAVRIHRFLLFWPGTVRYFRLGCDQSLVQEYTARLVGIHVDWLLFLVFVHRLTDHFLLVLGERYRRPGVTSVLLLVQQKCPLLPLTFCYFRWFIYLFFAHNYTTSTSWAEPGNPKPNMLRWRAASKFTLLL